MKVTVFTPLAVLLQQVNLGTMTFSDLVLYLKKGDSPENGAPSGKKSPREIGDRWGYDWAPVTLTMADEAALVMEWARVNFGFDPTQLVLGDDRIKTVTRSYKQADGSEEEVEMTLFEQPSVVIWARWAGRGYKGPSPLGPRVETRLRDDTRGLSDSPTMLKQLDLRQVRQLFDWLSGDEWEQAAVEAGDPFLKVKAIVALTSGWVFTDYFCWEKLADFWVWWLGSGENTHFGEDNRVDKDFKDTPWAWDRWINLSTKRLMRIMTKLGKFLTDYDDRKALALQGDLSLRDAVKGYTPGRTIGSWVDYAQHAVVDSKAPAKNPERREKVRENLLYLIMVRLTEGDPSYAPYLWNDVQDIMTEMGLAMVSSDFFSLNMYEALRALFESQLRDPETDESVAIPDFPVQVRNLRSAGSEVRVGSKIASKLVVPVSLLDLDPQIWVSGQSPYAVMSKALADVNTLIRAFEDHRNADTLGEALAKSGLTRGQVSFVLKDAQSKGGGGMKGLVKTLIEGDLPVNLILVKFKADKMKLLLFVFTVAYAASGYKGAIGQGLMFGLLTLALVGMVLVSISSANSAIRGTRTGLITRPGVVSRTLAKTKLAPVAKGLSKPDYIGMALVLIAIGCMAFSAGRKPSLITVLLTLFVMLGPVATFFKLQLEQRSQWPHVVAIVVIIGMIMFATTLPCRVIEPISSDSPVGKIIGTLDNMGVRVQGVNSTESPSESPEVTPESRNTLGGAPGW